jgi:hypothetical protein
MRWLKCLVSVMLGVLLGLLGACSKKGTDGDTKVPPDAKTGAEKEKGEPEEEAAKPPREGEDLPVRRPILE